MTRLWGFLALGGLAILSAFIVWHLVRRGRLIRDRLGKPRWPAPRLEVPEKPRHAPDREPANRDDADSP